MKLKASKVWLLMCCNDDISYCLMTIWFWISDLYEFYSTGFRAESYVCTSGEFPTTQQPFVVVSGFTNDIILWGKLFIHLSNIIKFSIYITKLHFDFCPAKILLLFFSKKTDLYWKPLVMYSLGPFSFQYDLLLFNKILTLRCSWNSLPTDMYISNICQIYFALQCWSIHTKVSFHYLYHTLSTVLTSNMKI